MKRLFTFLTASSVLVVLCLPVGAQRSSRDIKATAKTATETVDRGTTVFGQVTASFDGRGVLVKWTMTEETRNAGFFVHKTDIAGTRLVDEIMVLGSWASSRNDTVYGRSYDVYDRFGSMSAVYHVEAINIDGSKIFSQTVAPSGDARTATKRAERNSAVENKSPVLTDELQRAVSEATLPPNLANHRAVVAQPGVKIGIRREGFFRVTRTQLQNAGFNVNSNSANWRLFVHGNEQAINVGPADDYIEFFGRGIDTPESDTRMYYLIADSVPGKRIRERLMMPHGGNVVSPNYPFENLRKERTSYVNTIFNGDAENYWGRIVTSSPTTYTFPLSGIDTNVAQALSLIHI
jgi:hypothetical protein